MVILSDRQWANFDAMVSPEPNSGCWFWTGYVNPDGYGHFNFAGRIEKAHRVSYLSEKGKIPSGYLVLHRCDQPSCVNPSHLRLGTDVENGDDKAKRRRVPTKISDQDVRDIAIAKGRYRDIATKFNISPAWVCKIKSGHARPYARKSA